jgi:hypothetical protein
MKVRDLIAQLETQPGNATVYVQTNDAETGHLILVAVAGVDPAVSPAYGNAAVIELED